MLQSDIAGKLNDSLRGYRKFGANQNEERVIRKHEECVI